MARILVVDDEAHVRAMVGATLERRGYDVQLASSGREAMDMLERQPFDLVLDRHCDEGRQRHRAA